MASQKMHEYMQEVNELIKKVMQLPEYMNCYTDKGGIVKVHLKNYEEFFYHREKSIFVFQGCPDHLKEHVNKVGE